MGRSDAPRHIHCSLDKSALCLREQPPDVALSSTEGLLGKHLRTGNPVPILAHLRNVTEESAHVVGRPMQPHCKAATSGVVCTPVLGVLRHALLESQC